MNQSMGSYNGMIEIGSKFDAVRVKYRKGTEEAEETEKALRKQRLTCNRVSYLFNTKSSVIQLIMCCKLITKRIPEMLGRFIFI